MKTKIALIGSKDFTHHVVTAIAPDLPTIDIIPYIYTEPTEASKLLPSITPCDALLFSGALPYFFSKEAWSSITIPVLYLEQDETALVTSLLYILHHHGIQPLWVSIDLMDTSIIDHVASDLHLKNPPRHVMDCKERLPHHFDIREFTEFHRHLYESGETKLALTSIHAVYDQLIQLDIPCMRMIDPTKSLIRTIHEAVSQAELSKRKAATIAAATISLHDERNKLPLESLARLMKGKLQSEEDSYIIYSNRGSIEAFLGTDEFTTLFERGYSIHIGFGYGDTAQQARANAEAALSFAEQNKAESCAFILNEEKELSGPYPAQSRKQQLKNNHPNSLTLAKQLKMSPANLSKLIQFQQSRSSREFTAAELSDYLQITRRSSERMLKKLVDNGAAKITGEEMTYSQGRPRSIYELTFPIY